MAHRKRVKSTLRTEKIEIRVSSWDKNRIRILANEYAGGNVSLWVAHGALEAPRVYLAPKRKRL